MALFKEPQLEFLCELSVVVESWHEIGDTPHGHRRIAYVTGTIDGPRLKGRILPGAADWLLTRPDGVTEMDVRGTYQTDDDALIYVTIRGYAYEGASEAPDHAQNEQSVSLEGNYHIATPYFETAAPQYAWLTKVICIAMGTSIPDGVGFRLYTVS